MSASLESDHSHLLLSAGCQGNRKRHYQTSKDALENEVGALIWTWSPRPLTPIPASSQEAVYLQVTHDSRRILTLTMCLGKKKQKNLSFLHL